MIRYKHPASGVFGRADWALDFSIISKIKIAGLQQRWDLLQALRAIQNCSAATIWAKTGGNMEQFPTGKDLSSRAVESCPGNNRSAGKNKSSRTTNGNPWLRAALTVFRKILSAGQGTETAQPYTFTPMSSVPTTF
jgi:hypothetical protein